MGNQPPHAPQIIARNQKMSMQPATVDLKAGQAVQFVGSDGHLEVRIPANAITAADLAQAGGKLRLRITQIAPGSGSNAGGSGRISFGTYLLQLVDATGTVLTHGLRAPVTAIYHFTKKEGVLNLGHAYVVLNGARSQGVVSATLAQEMTLNSTFGALSSSPVTLDPVQHTMTVNPSLNTPSTSLSFQSDASIGAFGKPDPFSADLNAGALTASYPIDVPAGPGGLTPRSSFPTIAPGSTSSTTHRRRLAGSGKAGRFPWARSTGRSTMCWPAVKCRTAAPNGRIAGSSAIPMAPARS